MSYPASAERAASADAALKAYISRTSSDREGMSWRLAARPHVWAERTRLNFGEELRRAHFVYAVQMADEEVVS